MAHNGQYSTIIRCAPGCEHKVHALTRARLWVFAGFLLALFSSLNMFHLSFLLFDHLAGVLEVMEDSAEEEDGEIVHRSRRRHNNASFTAWTISSNNHLPLCRRVQIINGTWVPKILYAPPYISKTVHLRCVIPGYDYENPGPWKTWDWNPSDTSCRLAQWNAKAFCDLLPFSTVSIIGDSLSWEHFASLLQLLGARVHQMDQFYSRDEERNHMQIACTDSRQATKFVWRNNALLNATILADSIQSDFPTVLVLNRGAHYRNDTELASGLRRMFPVIKQWQMDCDKRETKCHLFWRTSVPGHPNCTTTSDDNSTQPRFTEPVNDFAQMDTYVNSPSSYNNKTLSYHWHDFQRQNQLALQELEDYAGRHRLRYEVLDAYHINVLRPDGHRWHQDDCLHNCYPGKIDVYSQLLLHFLQMQRTSADSQVLVDRMQRYREKKLSAIAANTSTIANNNNNTVI